MHTNYLLPHKYQRVGWLLFVPMFLFGVYLLMTGFEAGWLDARVPALFNDEIMSGDGNSASFILVENNLTNELVAVLFLTGALLVGFSREKIEDEFIGQLRLRSLMWAVLLNYLLLLLALLFVYGLSFFNVLVYNMFTVLILFIARFRYLCYKSQKMPADEK